GDLRSEVVLHVVMDLESTAAGRQRYGHDVLYQLSRICRYFLTQICWGRFHLHFLVSQDPFAPNHLSDASRHQITARQGHGALEARSNRSSMEVRVEDGLRQMKLRAARDETQATRGGHLPGVEVLKAQIHRAGPLLRHRKQRKFKARLGT